MAAHGSSIAVVATKSTPDSVDLHVRRPAAAQQRLRLFHARPGCAGPWPQCSAQSPGPRHGWGAVAQQPPGVDEVPHHAPLVGEGLREVRARAVQLAAAAAQAVDHLRAARPQAYHCVHAELGHVLLALGPRGVHALQRAPQRRRVHAPRGAAQHNVVPAADGAASDQPGPTYGNKFRSDCLASQQPSTKPRSGSTPLASPLRLHHAHADVQSVLVARLPQTVAVAALRQGLRAARKSQLVAQNCKNVIAKIRMTAD